MIQYTDSHCHLNALKLQAYEGGLSQAIAEARARGVANMLSVCTSVSDFPGILSMAEAYENIWASVGVHPLDLDRGQSGVDELVKLALHRKVVAIGETGLDFHYSAETKDDQVKSFIQHLQAGEKSGLPVIVHTREAKSETIELLKSYACRTSVGVLHCFTEDVAMAKKALDFGFYISLSGIVTFKNAEQLREVARYVPDDRLLIETDSPYLAPIPYRGRPNEPKFVVEVGNFIADLRNTSHDALAQLTTDNFFKLFSKAMNTRSL